MMTSAMRMRAIDDDFARTTPHILRRDDYIAYYYSRQSRKIE